MRFRARSVDQARDFSIEMRGHWRRSAKSFKMGGMKSKKSGLEFTIYHNPRCSKSRATLELLQERGVVPQVIEYLKTPPNADELKSILKKLKLLPKQLLRKNEDLYNELAAGKNLNDAQLIALMVDNPILIERPIVVVGNRAAMGRPPENILTLLK